MRLWRCSVAASTKLSALIRFYGVEGGWFGVEAGSWWEEVQHGWFVLDGGW